MLEFLTNFFLRKLVLSWRRREDSASRTKILGDFPRAMRPQKPIFDCGGQGCRINGACSSMVGLANSPKTFKIRTQPCFHGHPKVCARRQEGFQVQSVVKLSIQWRPR